MSTKAEFHILSQGRRIEPGACCSLKATGLPYLLDRLYSWRRVAIPCVASARKPLVDARFRGGRCRT